MNTKRLLATVMYRDGNAADWLPEKLPENAILALLVSIW